LVSTEIIVTQNSLNLQKRQDVSFRK